MNPIPSSTMRWRTRAGVVLLALAACGMASAQDAPDPTLADLVARAREHQAETEKLLSRYSWVQHEVFEMRKADGSLVQREQRKVRVYPVEGGVITDLIEVDGRAPTKKELAANEKRNRKTEAQAAARAAETDDEGDPDDDASGALLELLGRTNYAVAGRQVVDGRELIGIAFEPDPRAEGKGVEKKLLRHSRGTVWLDAETAQPVRGEAGAADKFRVGGIVGVKDFSLVAEQVRVGDEIWLPSRFEFNGEMTLLGARRRVMTEVTFSEYQRASVSMDAEVQAPAAGP